MFDHEDEGYDNYLNGDIEKFERFLKGEELGFIDADRMEALIDHYLISSQNQKAIKCAEYAVNVFSFQSIFHIRLAQALSTVGKLNEALKVLNAADVSFGNECEFNLTKASLFSQLKDSKSAIRFFKEALKHASNEEKDEIFLELAMELENAGEFQTAIAVLREAISTNPQNEGAIYELAYCYDRLGDHENAIKSYSDFIDENPYSYTSWYNLANAYSKLENFEKAIWAYDYCLLINPEFGAAYFNLGNAYMGQEKFRLAIEQFTKCMEMDGDDPIALCYVGECYEQLNELPLAKMFYQRSMDLAPLLADAWLGMGIVLDLEGKTFEALAFLMKAIELDPENGSYFHVLAGAYEKLNEFDLAEENYIKCLKQDCSDEECLDNFMQMMLDDDPVKALEFIHGFEEQFGKNGQTPLWIVNVYWHLGRKTDALYYFRGLFEQGPEEARKIFELNPDLKKAKEFKPFLEE